MNISVLESEEKKPNHDHTAIPYRIGTGREQGFPCVVFPHRENPVFITGCPGDENRFFPVGNTTQGKPCSHYRDGFAVCLQISQKSNNKTLLSLVRFFMNKSLV